MDSRFRSSERQGVRGRSEPVRVLAGPHRGPEGRPGQDHVLLGAHSITIDEYRISKRAGAGQSVVLEFRADRTGTVTFYCNMMQDERCRNMKGQLVVR